MKKGAIYRMLQAAVWCALAVLLATSAVSIYRDGQARRALDPLADIYTSQIVAEKLTALAPLFFVAVGLSIAGLVLGIRDEGAERPVKDPEIARNLTVTRVNQPSEAMRRERAAQRRLGLVGWGAFALCMVPIAVYLVNPDHFPTDLEAMFRGLLRVFLPWTVAGLGALSVTAVLRRRHVLREIEAAGDRLKEERAEGRSPAPLPADRTKGYGGVRTAILIAAVALIVVGVLNGSARDVLYKAITVCTECVGLG